MGNNNEANCIWSIKGKGFGEMSDIFKRAFVDVVPYKKDVLFETLKGFCDENKMAIIVLAINEKDVAVNN